MSRSSNKILASSGNGGSSSIHSATNLINCNQRRISVSADDVVVGLNIPG
jgi:hypothetical protein